MSNLEIVGLGALNMDDIYQVDRITGDKERAVNTKIAERAPGDEYEEPARKPLGKFPGGSAANTIYGLAKLGVKAGFIGVIGDDDDGKALLNGFQEVGIDISKIKVKPKAKTGLAMCLSDKLNFRSIRVTPGANSLLTTDDVDLEYMNQSEILHISSFTDDAQLEILLGLVDKLGSSVKISFSPGTLYTAKGTEALNSILARTYVLFLNEQEIKQLTGKDFSAGAEVCLKLGCHIVVVTLGQGASYKTVMATSYIRDGENEYIVERGNKNMVSALDTTGAGDAFAAGFLYGLLNGKGLEECGRLGDVVARFSISKVGARQGLPTLDELSQRSRELYDKEL
jgi:ribokinase